MFGSDIYGMDNTAEAIGGLDETNKYDSTMLLNEQRHVGKIYIPKKGRSTIADKVDKNRSQLLHTVLKPSQEEISRGGQEYLSTFKGKNN